MTLYELTDEYMQLLAMAEDPDIDPEVINDTLEGLEGEIEVKADGYATVIASLKSDVDMIKAETDRLNKRRQHIEASIEAMKRSLQTAMQVTGKVKFKTDRYSYGIQNNPPSVVIDEQYIENIPDEYLKYSEPTIDKALIKEHLKAGMDLSGIAHLEQTQSLRIR